ncbi:MAG: nucleotidyl transferase AbiEii/AbiGii toxin family protein [Candidatus Omnitrophica bacterium]|nr:nucleotidyl transferase AbiEii/AbiGii toxin family protein [Candidatus Omnitrophota bacterium]MBU1127796.1 nucleotidyl transferase AbiEii/AbiGii toxin family protein [Candidatus Omnitrophota bacterium]MBU1784657.1 nucleotidyl transferase AbiEii/AbiGii toxin family protein [Candidatus Omnitrophota bacterium]MBU1851327.1 nucleotidyl transferase AbiEii/AbiGii toxin family protein [Candidatus Omnitrophota bacterium]
MLNFNDVLSYYPEKLRPFRENILKEYLQYQILNIIFSTEYSNKLVFLGGTAIRIIHNSSRFSEDLDFDNRGLDKNDFKNVSVVIKKQLELDGYTVEIENVFKGAFHCYIKFPGLLFQNELSGHQKEKILIQLDVEPQKYDYIPEKYLLNKFGIFRYINAVPLDLLLSQKICACFMRKREKGRDFFDVVYLMGKTTPDYEFLKKRLKINTKKELVSFLKERSNTLNFKTLAKDIEPFLFDPTQKDRVLFFKDWLETI